MDGLEIIKSFLEEKEEERHEENKKQAEAGGNVVEAGKRPVLSDEELISAVEEVLKQNDRNHDGYIDLSEVLVVFHSAPTLSNAVTLINRTQITN